MGILLNGMPQPLLDDEVKTLVDEKFQVKRVIKGDSETYLHTKVVYVDRKLMYMGSDNAYKLQQGAWSLD